MNTAASILRHALFRWLAVLLLALGTTPVAHAVLPPQKPPTLTKLGANQYRLTWSGEAAGRVYFIQTSTNLVDWTYAPVVEYGAGSDISWDFSGTGSRFFIRLKHTVEAASEAAEGDLDSDGIKNLDEVKFFGSDPFVSNDADGDGYTDADETAQGTSPTDAGSKPFDPANPPVANRYVAPLGWWVENKFNDTVERATAQGLTGQISTWTNQATTLADGSYDMPYPTIQAAVNAASAGDVIQVAPGTYSEAVDLSAKNVRLIGQKGSREETVIEAPANSTQAILLGSGNTAGTTVSGFTLKNASGAAVKCQSGTAARLHNLLIQGSKCGIVADGASPVVLNAVIDGCTGTASTDAALRITGSSAVKASNCTITDNVPGNATGGQVQVSGGTASLTLVSSIVTSAGTSNRAGGQIQLSSGGTANVSWSSIRAGYTGTGNVTSQNPADYFDTDTVTGGQRRLLRACDAVDRGNPVGIPGFSYLTRLDSDGEFRRRSYGVALREGSADMGADEYVSRLKFPTIARRERGVTKTYSSVDEASDVASLGQTASGARIAIINDETIEDTSGTQYNDVTFFDISKDTGELVSTSYSTAARPLNRGKSFGGNEIKDPEAIAWDDSTKKLYITTSMTKVNHYRDCEPTTYDPLVDPPSNDYDPRRCVMVCVPVDGTTLSATGSNVYTDANDGIWNTTTPADRRDMAAFAAGTSAVSPVGYDSGKGLIATIQAQLSGNTALGAATKSAGVLIAISTSPKFGEPVNGTTYQPGAGLPYKQTTGLGGPSASAGWVLHLPANVSSADFPYYTLANLPAAGQEITGYKTSVGGSVTSLAANTTYYFKAWAYDSSRNYGRGMEAQTATTNVPPVSINEFQSAPVDVIELFNRSGQTVTIGDYFITDEQNRTSTRVASGTTIPARSFYRFNPAPFGLADGNNESGNPKSDNIRLYAGVFGSNNYGAEVDNYEKYTRLQTSGMGEGRVWDGGPRGKKFDFSGTIGFEAEGAYYKNVTGITHPQTLNDPATPGAKLSNSADETDPVKMFQAATDNVTQTGIYLHYSHLGAEPAVWRYSPKQQDFHPINVEGLAIKSQSEIVVGLRSPLSNRTTGNAYALVFSNTDNAMIPASGAAWTTAAGGFQSLKQLDLGGQGIRSIQWCPGIKNASGGDGAYLIIGGAANGGPLKNETTRQKFSLWRWDSITSTPVRVVADLSPFATRPEGINIITLNGVKRAILVEDRFKAEGYDTQNSVHWPITALNLQ